QWVAALAGGEPRQEPAPRVSSYASRARSSGNGEAEGLGTLLGAVRGSAFHQKTNKVHIAEHTLMKSQGSLTAGLFVFTFVGLPAFLVSQQPPVPAPAAPASFTLKEA